MRLLNMLNAHRDAIEDGFHWFRAMARRVARFIWLMAAVGLLLNVVATYVPEFTERFPVLYAWFDGWLQVAEFVVRTGVTAINALFTGHWMRTASEFSGALAEGVSQFVEWLGTVRF